MWDYQTKACVQTLHGHLQYVSAVAYHPELPVLMSSSEDGTVRLYNSNTYSLIKQLSYGYAQAFSLFPHLQCVLACALPRDYLCLLFPVQRAHIPARLVFSLSCFHGIPSDFLLVSVPSDEFFLEWTDVGQLLVNQDLMMLLLVLMKVLL